MLFTVTPVPAKKPAVRPSHTLRSTGEELKIMQELLRHSTIRVTLDTYTQVVTTEKRNAHEAVVSLLLPPDVPSFARANHRSHSVISGRGFHHGRAPTADVDARSTSV